MDQTEIEVAIEELEQRLERLRSLYEQYFLGIEKIEPTVAQKDVDRRIWVLRRVQVRSSTKRFRLQAIIQRFNTYQQHWVRICREIENGTYKRQLRKMDNKPALTIATRRRARAFELNESKENKGRETHDDASEVTPALQSKPGTARSGEVGSAPDAARKLPPIPGGAARPLPAIPGAAAKAPAQPATELGARPLPKPPAAAEAKPRIPIPAPAGAAAVLPPKPSPPKVGVRPPAQAGGALSEQRIRELHAELAREKQKLAEPASVSLDGLAKRLRVAEAKLQEQHRGKNVDFRVVVEGGKAVVKPVLR